MVINFNDFSNINNLVDRILDKISKDGYENLTDKEKEILNKHSQGNANLDDYKTKKSKKGRGDAKDHLSKMTGTNRSDWAGTEVIGIPPGESLSINLGVGKGGKKNLSRGKQFNVGDIVYVTNDGGNIPDYAQDYLIASDKFKVLRINDKGRIDIGCNTIGETGKKKVFYFSTNRFSLSKPKNDFDGGGDGWDNDNRIDNEPTDYYFAVSEFGGDVMVILTSLSYYERENCVDDRLGGHNISDSVKAAFRKIGISTSEDTEATWSIINEKTADEVIKGLIDEGFNNNSNFRNWLEKR